jgi:lycopene beta-cyclase
MSVAVIGSGPAAWALTAAVAARGVEVMLVAPFPESDWTQTYGMWTYQWSEDVALLCGTSEPWRHSWKRVVVIGDREHVVGRSYGVIDNRTVRKGFERTALGNGASFRTGRVVGVEAGEETTTLRLDDGSTVEARLVFDGTGAGSKFLRYRSPREATDAVLQTAFGRTVRAWNVPFPDDTCVLIDWWGDNRDDPSFLYALPFGDGIWLFEETSLARRNGLPSGELQRRLQERLDALGIGIIEEVAAEQVRFPMDTPIPRRGQRVVGIGASAGLIHPATGYSVAASLRSAVPLAEVVAATLRLPVDEAAKQCWSTLWSNDRRLARRLETFGRERLAAMDQSETRAFFDTFFDLPPWQTELFLGGEAGARELGAVMSGVFRRAPVGCGDSC